MTPPSHTCCRCGAAAKLRCTGCFEGVDTDGARLPTTWYCSRDCQAADRKRHKSACRLAKDYKQLYRGVALVQELFYFVRETAYDATLLHVKREGARLRIYLDHSPLPPYTSHLSLFPDALVNNAEDKKAILSWLCCNEALCWMFKMLVGVFEGIVIPSSSMFRADSIAPDMKCCVSELQFRVKRSFDYVFEVDANGMETPSFPHNVVRVTFEGGESFVIDLTGAQHRQFLPVLPLLPYIQRYAEDLPQEEEFGACDEEWRGRYPTGPNGEVPPRSFVIHMMDQVDDVVAQYEGEGGRTVAKILNLEQSAFERERSKLLTAIKEEIRTMVKRIHEQYQKGKKENAKATEDSEALLTKIENIQGGGVSKAAVEGAGKDKTLSTEMGDLEEQAASLQL